MRPRIASWLGQKRCCLGKISMLVEECHCARLEDKFLVLRLGGRLGLALEEHGAEASIDLYAQMPGLILKLDEATEERRAPLPKIPQGPAAVLCFDGKNVAMTLRNWLHTDLEVQALGVNTGLIRSLLRDSSCRWIEGTNVPYHLRSIALLERSHLCCASCWTSMVCLAWLDDARSGTGVINLHDGGTWIGDHRACNEGLTANQGRKPRPALSF
mmetsp:Transcript_47459/g.85432  ORF Transcript_47459/g.85432 Transcript_47459/m.85432 type:complete len:214 (-) Transcript_47459:2627-3268(-)